LTKYILFKNFRNPYKKFFFNSFRNFSLKEKKKNLLKKKKYIYIPKNKRIKNYYLKSNFLNFVSIKFKKIYIKK
jgi:hypothetical protein